MVGVLMNEKEAQEMEYLLKKELEELICDMDDDEVDPFVKKALEEKYQIILNLLKRFVSPKESLYYVNNRRKR
ncbi:hypothetical protein SAMN05192534_12082 [Alteribacillus persepolensis]|uniref:Uncharacterized protein n=1 Tax=Alteribacillus persepolensis TaxID=568899 RepID=A0A1G8HMS4_9BACI|nr:hypothetical protein [Alteribacillus persepolensis]SDI07973.1 hypothetical protein SAMN05192534_12082 [Alteribacillus persepolensis]